MTIATEFTRMTSAADFEFLDGSWTVKNRRLNERLADCEEWTEFEGQYECMPILFGKGNVDSMRWTTANGQKLEGCSLRLYSADEDLWRIYWLDSRAPAIEAPMIGRFEGDVCDFSASEVIDGRTILVRFIWTKLDQNHARWEQAFSPDLGDTWETNWVMEFERR